MTHKIKNLIMLFVSAVFLISFIGCMPKEIVKVDLNSFNENPEIYENKRVVFKTDIKTLINDPTLYHFKDVEITGYVKREIHSRAPWKFKLVDDEGVSVKCYEMRYTNYPWHQADFAVKRARHSNESMTVVGTFRKNATIELDWIEYDGQTIDTDYKPYVHRFPIWW